MRSHGVARSVIQYTVCTYMCNVYIRDICMCICVYIYTCMNVCMYLRVQCMYVVCVTVSQL